LIFHPADLFAGSFGLDEPLLMPPVGSAELRILAPDLLELSLVTTKEAPPARPTQWNFVAANFQYVLPSVSKFAVKMDEAPVQVQSVGFKRRPIYAPFRKRDLRIGNHLYLKLTAPLTEGQQVEVKNPDGSLWGTNTKFRARFDPQRFSPSIHVNQQGYVPGFPKKANIGFYLGSFGELNIPAGTGFSIVNDLEGTPVHQGIMTLRTDRGYTYSQLPYQKVWEADFSEFKEPGRYRLVVSGLGSSYPFRIDEGAAACFARTYALGLYHQRCGVENSLPFTRHTHGACHTNQAEIPTMTFSAVNKALAAFSSDYAKNPRHTARQLKDVNSSLYPFLKTGRIEVSGGHHDAGDYSKYTINVAQLIHSLIFAVDNFEGTAGLDNLGLPESDDGISDLLQEAKIEANFLSKMQDDDGGFYFLVYPRNRSYEDNVLPDRGDPQVVFPKNTAATAAAVAALAQTASSPLFKQTYPELAGAHLAQARKGWDFLQNAMDRHGRDGAYQKISHYGNEFMHDDELAWAAAELFLATGDPAFENELISRFNPSSFTTWRFGWTRLWEGYGCAIRSYAFGARSGRLSTDKLNTTYLDKCRAEIISAAEDQLRFSREHAYGSSFPDPNKTSRTAGWYFSLDQTFDLATAMQFDPRAEFLDAILRNMNYEGGSNPLNLCFLTGIGNKRQREVVHQFAINDRRILPPSGLPQGNIQRDFSTSSTLYPNELPGLCFPSDNAVSSPYAPYDIWADTYNVTTEFVNPQQGRGLAVLAFLMAQTGLKDQAWKPVPSQIELDHPNALVGTSVGASLKADGLDLSRAEIVWEGRSHEPFMGSVFPMKPEFLGTYWVEAEALLPDGRRIVASSQFSSLAGHRTILLSPNHIQITGIAGQKFTLQSSPDLRDWESILTDTFMGTGYDYFDDSGSKDPVRFYRALATP